MSPAPLASYPRKFSSKAHSETRLTPYISTQSHAKTLATILPFLRRRLLLVMATIHTAFRGKEARTLRIRVPGPSSPERASGMLLVAHVVVVEWH